VAQASVPFKRLGEHLIVVQGALGGLAKRNLVIDTGAYPSILDTAVARKLHISGQRQELDAVNHRLSRPVVIVPSVELGPIRAQEVRAMTADLSAASQAFGLRIDALIGLDVLQHSSFLVDYGARRIVFADFERLPLSVPFQWSGGLLTVDLQDDSGRLRMLVDTGAQSTLLLGRRFRHTDPSRDRVFTNLGGNFTLSEVTLKEVQLGNFELGSQTVLVADSPKLPAYPFDGFLSTIQFDQIAFDFERQTFSWRTRDSNDRRVQLTQGTGTLTPNLSALSAGVTDAETSVVGRIP
jgi:predicted aspartyl protease